VLNRLSKLKKWQPVELQWVDSAHGSGWKWEEDTDFTDSGTHQKSVGYYRSHTKETITIVQSYCSDWSDQTMTDARMSIPLVAITKLKLL